MGEGRAHHDAMDLAWQVDVVGITSGSGEEARILRLMGELADGKLGYGSLPKTIAFIGPGARPDAITKSEPRHSPGVITRFT